ncbi:MAG: glycosyltransferase [Sedimentisphaeraceae bacterium JB056]
MSIEAVYIITTLLVSSQILFMFFVIKNARFVIKKSAEKRDSFVPKTLLTVPCKGLDTGFEDNIKSFFVIDYADYYLNFVVESKDDDAYDVLLQMKEEYASRTKAREVNILIAGVAEKGSQKNHNLLHSISVSGGDKEVFAFADSDARPRVDWLSHLVYPLNRHKTGASSGYRWIVPAKHNFATLLLSSANSKVAQFLGKSIFNQAWGGSMAIKREMFYQLHIDKLWDTCISDDLSLTYAVNNAGYRLRFSPGCLVATYEQTTMSGLFEFARRQFLITRKSAFGIWFIGLFSNIYSVIGIWVSLIMAFYFLNSRPNFALPLFITSGVFIVCQLIRVFIRQHIASSILVSHEKQLKKAAVFDYMTSAVGSIFMLIFIISSAFGSKIVWRGTKYKIVSATKTERID